MNKKILNQTFKMPDYLLFGMLFAFPIATFFFRIELAVVELIAAVAYLIFRISAKKQHSEQLYNYLQSITLYLDEASKESLTRFPMPVTLLNTKGDIIWYNDLFHNILLENKIPEVFGKNFDVVAPQISIGEESVSQDRKSVV